MKKVLIWIGCYFSLSFLITILKTNFGIWLGFIPTFILYSVTGWLANTLCKKADIKKVEKEAFAKGMSIRQYVASITPPELIKFCEEHKGEKVVGKTIKHYVDENLISKRIALVLSEMYE